MTLSLVLLLLIGALSATMAHQCAHHTLDHKITVDPQFFGKDGRKRATSETQPLRVHFDTDDLGGGQAQCKAGVSSVVTRSTRFNCEPKYYLTQQLKNTIRKVLAELAKDVAEMLYIVRSPTGTTLRDYPWCYDGTLSIGKYTASSSDPIKSRVDVILKVTSWPTSGSVTAWAGACRKNQFGRPIAGHMNFGPQALQGASYQYVYAVAMHELFHALGFSDSAMEKFIDGRGQAFNPVVTDSIGSSGRTKTAYLIGSPKVKQAARDFFQCPSLAGMETEDYRKRRSDGPGSHWEKRIMGHEVMTPSTGEGDPGPYVSAMTLAFFEDMGVYYPDYSKVREPSFGKHRGCDFATGNPDKQGPGYDCLAQATSQCNPAADGYSSCQYFIYNGGDQSKCISNPFYTPDTSDCTRGGDSYSDFKARPGTAVHCNGPISSQQSAIGDSHGASSRCFTSNVFSNGQYRTVASASCYPTRCKNNGSSSFTMKQPEPQQPEPQQPEPQQPEPQQPDPQPEPQQPVPAQMECGDLQDCESCGAKSECSWCQQGFAAFGRVAGFCGKKSEVASQCTLRDTYVANTPAECYPKCSQLWKGEGQCRHVDDCAGTTYKFLADGCDQYDGNDRIRCCITDDRKRSVPKAAVQVVAKESVEKRAASDWTYEIQVHNKWLQCPSEGGKIDYDAWSGVTCLPVEDVCCANNNNCNGNGDCKRGVCICKPGFVGADCAQSAPARQTAAPVRDNWPSHSFVQEDDLGDFFEQDEDEPELEKLADDYGNASSEDVQQGDGNNNNKDDGTGTMVVIGIVGALVVCAACVGALLFFVYFKKRAHGTLREQQF